VTMKAKFLPIKDIALDYENGLSTSKLSEKYGMSAETIRKRLIANGTKMRTKSEALMGNQHVKGRTLSDEHKEKLRVAGYSRINSSETRKKISESKIGKKRAPFSDEWKEKLGASLRGKKHSEKSTQKAAASLKRRYQEDDDLRKKRSEQTKKQWLNPGYRERMSGANNCMSRPEVRAKVSGEKCWLWKGGISFEPYCPKFTERLKESIREEFGRKCFICGLPESKNGERLSVHHCDYQKSQGCNGQRWSLIPLCHNCHTKTSRMKWFYFSMLRDYWIYEYIDFFNF